MIAILGTVCSLFAFLAKAVEFTHWTSWGCLMPMVVGLVVHAAVALGEEGALGYMLDTISEWWDGSDFGGGDYHD